MRRASSDAAGGERWQLRRAFRLRMAAFVGSHVRAGRLGAHASMCMRECGWGRRLLEMDVNVGVNEGDVVGGVGECEGVCECELG